MSCGYERTIAQGNDDSKRKNFRFTQSRIEVDDTRWFGRKPQFVVFEVTYVLQSLYNVSGDRLASMVRDLVSFPGVQIVDDCPWKRVLEVWPDPLGGLADAAIVAVATTNRYEAVATFDRKLANRLKSFGFAAYW